MHNPYAHPTKLENPCPPFFVLVDGDLHSSDPACCTSQQSGAVQRGTVCIERHKGLVDSDEGEMRVRYHTAFGCSCVVFDSLVQHQGSKMKRLVWGEEQNRPVALGNSLIKDGKMCNKLPVWIRRRETPTVGLGKIDQRRTIDSLSKQAGRRIYEYGGRATKIDPDKRTKTGSKGLVDQNNMLCVECVDWVARTTHTHTRTQSIVNWGLVVGRQCGTETLLLLFCFSH